MVQTVRLGDETYKKLADFKAWLIVHGYAEHLSERERDFDWAVDFLLDEYSSEYNKRMLKESQKK